ncbi:MAG: ABC transporter permease [Calditrichaeota bacterium]|nr:ABC transporter permease [Calditrichota bacterium]MCB0268128.1 ABC transporter permease [Calditrichota bacterium]
MSEIAHKFFGSVGRWYLDSRSQMGEFFVLIRELMYWLVIAPLQGKGLKWKNTIDQMVKIGFNSLPIVCLISFFVGLIIAMQSSYQLKAFGATIYTANLTAVSIIRELAPLLTSIIITGRSGSAITAEIGTMKVSEEIDALETMGLNPVKFLVVPRVLAMLIMVPCLTIIADIVGIFGGYLISMLTLDLTSVRYIDQTIIALTLKDLFSGLIKSAFFALIIAGIGCYQGLIVKGGAEGVGKSTTQSVVVSIFLIIVADVFFTVLFYSGL